MALYDLFCMIDKNESTGIATNELMHMLLNLGEDVSEALVDDMVTLVDKNGDKEIDFDEFFEIMTGDDGFYTEENDGFNARNHGFYPANDGLSI